MPTSGYSFDWVQEPTLPDDAPAELAEKIDEIGSSDTLELAGLFGYETVVFELREPGRGGGHDGSTCLVAIGTD
ncbi:hypothetical protein A9W97_17415 [Mycobacterium gordonae]|nr:hypothetical protein A9W97_17415 [Mycobacterium gordonae]